MKRHLFLFLGVTALIASAARADRVLWTETATIRTKTIFGDDGGLLFQQNWDKASGSPVGVVIDRRGGAVSPASSVPAQVPAPAPAPPPVVASSPTQGWISGPFQVAPAPHGGQLSPQAQATGLSTPEGRENPHPEWSRLYAEANAPLPERDGYGLPPPPPVYPEAAAPAAPPLQGRPLHPEAASGTRFERAGGKVMMRPDNMVRVKVLDKISSKRNKRGDTFRYVILEPIQYGLRTLVPAGTKGMGRVGRAKPRGFFGRPGLLDLEFGSVDLPGATPARIYLAETVISPEPREPEALGAGAVGLVAFGPLGLAGGALVRGHDVHVEAGSVFHVEVAVDVPYMHTASR